MSNIKNLNEEISRIKSLFGEERLYGNLIGESLMVNEEKELITEQAKPIVRFLNTIFDTIKKSGKSKITSDVDGVKTIYKISPDGVITKNGDLIDEKNVSNVLSDLYKSKVGRQIDNISTDPENFAQYLSIDGYQGISLKNHFYEMIDDLVNQNLIDERYGQNFKNEVNSSGVLQEIGNIFKTKQTRDEFIKSINGDMDFGKKYPEIYELFNFVPQLKKRFYSRFFKSDKIFSDEYDNLLTFVNILKKRWGNKISKDGEPDRYESFLKSFYTTDGELNLKYNYTTGMFSIFSNKGGGKLPSKIEKELRNEVKKIREVNPDALIEIKSNGIINFSAKNLKDSEKKRLFGVIDNEVKLPKKVDADEVSTKINPIEVEDIEIDNLIGRKTDLYTNYYKDYIANFFKNSRLLIRDVLNSNEGKSVLDVVSTRISRFLDPVFLRKNGYMATKTKGKKQIDSNWQSILNTIYKVDEPIKGSNGEDIFIKTDKEGLLYGLRVGDIKPNLSKKPGWEEGFEKSFLKKYNLGLKGDYKSVATDKVVRNIMLQAGIPTYGIGYIVYSLLWGRVETAKLVIEEGKKLVMNKIRGSNVNPTTILIPTKINYEKQCLKSIEQKIIKVYGVTGAAMFDTYFGESGELKGITKIDVAPTKFVEIDGGYDDKEKFPKLTSVSKVVDSEDIVGDYADLGEIYKDGDDYFLKTIPNESGEFKKISLNCDPSFNEFWEDSWIKFYELQQSPEKLDEKMVELSASIEFEKVVDGGLKEEFGKVVGEITMKAVVDKVEKIKDEVKEVGEAAQEYIEDNSKSTGDVGEKLEY